MKKLPFILQENTHVQCSDFKVPVPVVSHWIAGFHGRHWHLPGAAAAAPDPGMSVTKSGLLL